MMRPTTAGIAALVATALSVTALAQDRKSCLETTDSLQAIRACSEIVRSHPKDPSAYHLRGDALAKNGDLGQALADYTKAIEINPRFAAAYRARAQLYTTMGDLTRAAADATKASELESQKGQAITATPQSQPKPKMVVRKKVPRRKTASPLPQKNGQEKKAAPVWVDGRLIWQ